MKATIKDVAKLAGVSFKTVSRVVNKEGTVGQDLQEKVMKAVKELNYQPNLSARLLRGTASSIGFIYDNPNSNYVIDMQRGILGECHRQGYELVIHPCDAKSKTIIDEVIGMVDRSRVGGLVLTPPVSEMPEVLSALNKRKLKYVRILSGANPPDTISPCVFIDDRTAAYKITQYLIDLGHKAIAFLGGDEAHKSSTERMEGYKAALKDNKIPVDKKLIALVNCSAAPPNLPPCSPVTMRLPQAPYSPHVFKAWKYRNNCLLSALRIHPSPVKPGQT